MKLLITVSLILLFIIVVILVSIGSFTKPRKVRIVRHSNKLFYIEYKRLGWDCCERIEEVKECMKTNVTFYYPFKTHDEAEKVVEIIKKDLGI